MNKKLFTALCAIIVIVMSFGAVCAEDVDNLVDMIRTEVAATVYAEIQGTLSSDGYEIIVKNDGTPSPLVDSGIVWGTWKPTPTYYSYAAKLTKQDKNYMHYAHGVQFTVTWTVQNTGPLDWTEEFYFRYVQGQGSLDGDLEFVAYPVAKGDTVTFSRSFECADEPGIYNSYWELVDDDGVVILDNIWVGWQVDDWRQ